MKTNILAKYTLFALICSIGPIDALPAMALPAQPRDEVPANLPVNLKLRQGGFLMLSAEEKAAALQKARTQPWARDILRDIEAQAKAIMAKPNLFPEKEGGWTHLYISPDTGEKLQFDVNKPHEHLDAKTKIYHQGAKLDAAWNSLSINLTAEQQQILAVAYLLTDDKKYAQTMKQVFLDIAQKYSKYRLHDKSGFGGEASTGAYATAQSIDECNYFTSLALSYDTLVGSGVLSAQEKSTIETQLWKPMVAYMDRLMEIHPSGGNWWTWHAAGAVVVGIVMRDEALVDKGLNMPKYGILAQLRSGYVNADGFTGELSPGYHHYPFIALTRMAIATKQAGIDFYKIPRFKKMFDLPLKIMQPNLSMPRLNDGAYVSLVNAKWASIYEMAAGWYGTPAYSQLLNALYHSDVQPVAGTKFQRDSVNALLYGPITLSTTPLDNSKSDFLFASGLSIMRSPYNDWNVGLKNDIGDSGHRHPDALNLILYANGEDAFPGTGSPIYGNPTYLNWYTQTPAHNTITLNNRSQIIRPQGKKIEFGVSQWGASAVSATANSEAIQGPQNKNLEAASAFLRRTVVVTPHAIVDVFHAGRDEKAVKPNDSSLPANLSDWTLHMNGKMSMAGNWKDSSDVLAPSPSDNKASKISPAYKFIKNLQENTESNSVRGQLQQPKGGKIDFWLAAPASEGKVYQAMGLGPESSIFEQMPMLIQRRQANETTFRAVYAPFKKTSQVQSVRFLSASDKPETVIEIDHIHGKDLIISLPKDGTLDAQGASLQGVLGSRIQLQNNQLLLLVGRSWKDENVEINLNTSGSIVLENTAKQVRIHNDSDNPVEGTVTIKQRQFQRIFALAPHQTIELE